MYKIPDSPRFQEGNLILDTPLWLEAYFTPEGTCLSSRLWGLYEKMRGEKRDNAKSRGFGSTS